MGDLLQILLLMAYLSIGLIAITIPTYAIAVSYLSRETSWTMEDLKRKRRDVKKKLEQLKEKLEEEHTIEALKEEIERYEKEEKELKDRLLWLSAKGAVGYPCVFFLITLGVASYGISTYPENIAYPFGGAIVFIFFGLLCLGKSLQATEKAALKRELPAFRLSFMTGSTIERCHVGEQKQLNCVVTNYGVELAEDVHIAFFFPPEFQVATSPYYSIIGQRARRALSKEYPNYNAAVFTVNLIHVDMAWILHPISVKIPEKSASYEIPAAIRARKVGRTEHKLTIEVVEKNKELTLH